MRPMHRKCLRVIRTPEVAACIAYHEDDQLWRAEIFARTQGGVQFLETAVPSGNPPEELLIHLAFHLGHFSPRPCSLDRQFDPSMTYGLLALLRHWCRIHTVDVSSLMREAFPHELLSTENFEEIVAQAEWEGIEYPRPDDRYQTRRLLLALRDVGYGEIAKVLIDVIRTLP
jgi:hypothetical protein